MTDETRATKITFGEMRASGVHRILISCSDYRCSVFLRRAPPCVMRHGCEDIGV
jgi:hypothetical protein